MKWKTCVRGVDCLTMREKMKQKIELTWDPHRYVSRKDFSSTSSIVWSLKGFSYAILVVSLCLNIPAIDKNLFRARIALTAAFTFATGLRVSRIEFWAVERSRRTSRSSSISIHLHASAFGNVMRFSGSRWSIARIILFAESEISPQYSWSKTNSASMISSAKFLCTPSNGGYPPSNT